MKKLNIKKEKSEKYKSKIKVSINRNVIKVRNVKEVR
jgi:hypothetical protein